MSVEVVEMTLAGTVGPYDGKVTWQVIQSRTADLTSKRCAAAHRLLIRNWREASMSYRSKNVVELFPRRSWSAGNAISVARLAKPMTGAQAFTLKRLCERLDMAFNPLLTKAQALELIVELRHRAGDE